MASKSYNFKDLFRLRIRIGLLIVLAVFIIVFVFSPKREVKTKPSDPTIPPITWVPAPEPLVNIAEMPEGAIGKIISEDYIDEYLEPIKTNIFTDVGKEARVEFGNDVIFYIYEVPPMPLNLDDVNFEYPRHLVTLGIEGTIYLQLLIDKEGNVRDVKIIKGLFYALDEIVVEKAWKLRFSPAMQRDKPVAVYYSFPVEFKLE